MSARVLVGAATVLVLIAGCSAPPEGVEAVGTVVDDPTIVSVPVLGDATSGARVKTVLAAQGDAVRTGQELATMDDALLVARIGVATADEVVARAQVDVLTSAIAKTYDKAADVADARSTVRDAISKLTATRAKLLKARGQVKRTRAQLVTRLEAARTLLANYPPVPVPGVPSRDQLRAAIAQLTAGIAKLDAGLRTIARALPRLATGLRKAGEALAKLAEADAKIVDARHQLRDARELARIGAKAAAVPVSLARLQKTLATVTSPADGTVISIASAGDQLSPGATLVKIRTGSPSRITAWLATDQLARVCLGDRASVSGDWMAAGAGMPATLTRIGTELTYPPSNTTTDEVHLTRAVEVQLTASGTLPAGVPVELSISGCRS